MKGESLKRWYCIQMHFLKVPLSRGSLKSGYILTKGFVSEIEQELITGRSVQHCTISWYQPMTNILLLFLRLRDTLSDRNT